MQTVERTVPNVECRDVTPGVSCPIYRAVGLESFLRNSLECPDYSAISSTWQDLWAKAEQLTREGYRVRRWYGPWYTSWFTDKDFENVKANLGLNVSCQKYAGVVNRLLEGRGCCYRVTCDNMPASIALPYYLFSMWDITAGVNLHDFFK